MVTPTSTSPAKRRNSSPARAGLWPSTGTTATAPSWSTSPSPASSSARPSTPPPPEIYRALIEATAFGALTIINRFEEYGVAVRRVVNCGGIAEKNPLVMQIYADVTGRPNRISRSGQTCALGAAIAGAVVAGKSAGGYATYGEAQKAMTGLKARVFRPNPADQAVYKELYSLYRKLHDAFGTKQATGSLYDVMKQLIEIRNRARK